VVDGVFVLNAKWSWHDSKTYHLNSPPASYSLL
jgi:hypothetical protein